MSVAYQSAFAAAVDMNSAQAFSLYSSCTHTHL